MPRTRSLAWAELKIGLMSVFALVVATAFIFLLTGSNGFFWQRYSIKTVFPDVAGLKEGAPVRVAGVEVGTVTGVEFSGDRVEVVMEVLKENRLRITNTSFATRLGVAAGRSGSGHHRIEVPACRFRIGAT